ncbi:MAG: beta-lactamase family protein [Pyrinomonadaceae bacterium]|nr:beta-lactamase family protein [Pyrinomonadaceae bacterium]
MKQTPMENNMYSKRVPFFALVVSLLVAVAVKADTVDDYVKAQMQQQHTPGLSLAVVKAGRVIKAEGYGLANVELNVPARPETIYKIGSVSKQFIATGIMLLVEEGKVSLDDKISKFLEGTPDTWKEITVRHLLTHTSGIIREAPGFHPFKVQENMEVIRTAYPLPLRFTPGEKWEYCNVGYFTLAEIIHKVSGKPWEDYLSERVFKQLAMSVTRTTSVPDIIPNRAAGYGWQNGRLQNAGDLLAMRPSGAFVSNILDLAKWEAALYTDKILKPHVREQMWVRATLNNGNTYPYGFGWELAELNGHRLVRHGGTLAGFRAEFARFTDDKLTIIILTNCVDAKPKELALGVAGFYVSDLVPPKAR